MPNQTTLNVEDTHAVAALLAMPPAADAVVEQLEHPGHGLSLGLDMAAAARFTLLARRALAGDPALTGRIDPAGFRKALGREFLNRFAHLGRPVSESQVARMLGSALRGMRGHCRDVDHVLPVSPAGLAADRALALGPVRFTPFAVYAAGHGEDHRLGDWAGREAHVAEVTVLGCDAVVSAERAAQAVERARDILRLLPQDRRDLSAGAELLPLLGRTLVSITDPAAQWPLAERLLDAVGWWGIAAREEAPAAVITLLVNAMERLTITRAYDRVSKSVGQRSAALAQLGGDGRRADLERRASEIYLIRCELVHGGLSPFDPALVEAARAARALVADVIFGGLRFFDRLGLDRSPVSNKALARAYVELTR